MLFSTFKNRIPYLQETIIGGITTQFKLAPSYRKPYNLMRIKAKNPVKAAVLIIIFPDSKNNTAFILTKRPNYDGQHANQISFPGGKQNPEDLHLLDTALRETKEEIGLDITSKSIFKKLTEVYIPTSNFMVQPYLAILDMTPNFTTNYEVEKIVTPTLFDLLNNKNQKITHVKTSDGRFLETPYFSLENEVVWGATAMMLSELKDLIQKTV